MRGTPVPRSHQPLTNSAEIATNAPAATNGSQRRRGAAAAVGATISVAASIELEAASAFKVPRSADADRYRAVIAAASARVCAAGDASSATAIRFPSASYTRSAPAASPS